MRRIPVLLADDHTIVREGIRMMLQQEEDLEVVGEAEDGHRALALALELRPAVVLMDIAMPLLNGLECARQMLKALPETKVLILSAHGDDAYVRRAIESGAKGFLLKQSSANEVSRAIRQVHKGNAYFTASISRRLSRLVPQEPGRRPDRPDRPGIGHKKAASLTPREMEVLQLIAEGLANKQIADLLRISIKTVEKHRGHLMSKLDIHDVAGLTRYAISTGVIESSVQLTILPESV